MGLWQLALSALWSEWGSNGKMPECFRDCQALSLQVSSRERKSCSFCVSQKLANPPTVTYLNLPLAWLALLTRGARGSLARWCLEVGLSFVPWTKKGRCESLQWSLWPLGVTLGPKIMYCYLQSIFLVCSLCGRTRCLPLCGRIQMFCIFPACVPDSF